MEGRLDEWMDRWMDEGPREREKSE